MKKKRNFFIDEKFEQIIKIYNFFLFRNIFNSIDNNLQLDYSLIISRFDGIRQRKLFSDTYLCDNNRVDIHN
jgi:hypothetical protein